MRPGLEIWVLCPLYESFLHFSKKKKKGWLGNSFEECWKSVTSLINMFVWKMCWRVWHAIVTRVCDVFVEPCIPLTRVSWQLWIINLYSHLLHEVSIALGPCHIDGQFYSSNEPSFYNHNWGQFPPLFKVKTLFPYSQDTNSKGFFSHFISTLTLNWCLKYTQKKKCE